MPKQQPPVAKSPRKVPVRELTAKERRQLRALGHALSPVVQVGKGGLRQGVVDELKRALQAHELIKVRLLGECPLNREAAGATIAKQTSARLVQKLGNNLLYYRPNLDQPKLQLGQVELAPAVVSRPASGKPRRRRLAPTRGVRTRRAASPRAATNKKGKP